MTPEIANWQFPAKVDQVEKIANWQFWETADPGAVSNTCTGVISLIYPVRNSAANTGLRASVAGSLLSAIDRNVVEAVLI